MSLYPMDRIANLRNFTTELSMKVLIQVTDNQIIEHFIQIDYTGRIQFKRHERSIEIKKKG